MESKAYVRLKYGKSTVKYGKSTVLYGNFFVAPTVPPYIYIYTYRISSNLYTPDSASLASLARQKIQVLLEEFLRESWVHNSI